MPRGSCNIRQSDITKAIKAAKDAGLSIARYEIDSRTGKIVVVPGSPPESSMAASPDTSNTNDFGG